MKNALSALFIVATVIGYPAAAGATTIEFEAVNLGGSLWRYDYFLTEGFFDAHEGFMVFFDPDLYEDLNLVLPTPPGWDVRVTVPNLTRRRSVPMAPMTPSHWSMARPSSDRFP